MTRESSDPAPFDGFPVEGSERIYDSPWCGLRRDMLRLPDGSLQEYHVVEIADAVVVVPLCDDGRIVFVWQYRHPHGGSHFELPAGRVHADEAPEDAAARELREETGYVPREMERVSGFYPVNGISAHFGHVFVARGCRPAGAARPEASERLSVHVLPRDEVERRLRAGAFLDGFTALALFYVLAHETRRTAAG